MKGGHVALCCDSVSLEHPALLGLDDVIVESLEWVRPFTQGRDLRIAVAGQPEFDEVWILSSDDIARANLVASLRNDGYVSTIVCIVANDNEEEKARAVAAGASRIVDENEFSQMFILEIARRSRMKEAQSVFEPAFQGHINEPVQPAVSSGNPRYKEKQDSSLPLSSTISLGSGFILSLLPTIGGVGRTVIAGMIAYMLSKQGVKVLLVDGNWPSDMYERMFGADALVFEESISDEEMSRVSKDAEGKPCILKIGRFDNSSLSQHPLAEIASQCSCYFDAVIVDSPPLWNDAIVSLLELSSACLLILDQRLGSIRALCTLLNHCKSAGLATSACTFALNRCNKNGLLSSTDISNVVGGHAVYEVCDGGPLVEEFSQGAQCAQLVMECEGFVSSIARMIESITPFSLPSFTSGRKTEELTRQGFSAGWGRSNKGARKSRSRKRKEFEIQRGVPHNDARLGAAKHSSEMRGL